MTQTLLHVDSSILGGGSVSRTLSASDVAEDCRVLVKRRLHVSTSTGLGAVDVLFQHGRYLSVLEGV